MPQKSAPASRKNTYSTPKLSRSDAESIRSILKADVVALRRRGLSFEEIGEELGCNADTASEQFSAAIKQAVRRCAIDAREEMLLDLERCDMALAGLAPKVEKGEVPACLAWVRVLERRAKYLGIDAPVQVQITESDLPTHELEMRLARLMEQARQELPALPEGTIDVGRQATQAGSTADRSVGTEQSGAIPERVDGVPVSNDQSAHEPVVVGNEPASERSDVAVDAAGDAGSSSASSHTTNGDWDADGNADDGSETSPYCAEA